MKEIPSFFKKPDPITDIADTKEYDIVVIGAGSPGVPCALKAAELGAKVAILQKEKEAAACGNFGAGILTDKSDPVDVEKCVSMLEAASSHRAKRSFSICGPRNPARPFSGRLKGQGSRRPGRRYGNECPCRTPEENRLAYRIHDLRLRAETIRHRRCHEGHVQTG